MNFAMENKIQKTKNTIILSGNLGLNDIVANYTVKKIVEMQKMTDDGIHSIQHHYINNKDTYFNDIRRILVNLGESLSSHGNLTESQINEIPILLYAPDFYYLTVEDVALYCANIKRGVYGTIYKMDISVFFDHLYEYMAEKDAAIEEQQTNRKNELTIKSDKRLNDKIKAEKNANREALAKHITENLKK